NNHCSSPSIPIQVFIINQKTTIMKKTVLALASFCMLAVGGVSAMELSNNPDMAPTRVISVELSSFCKAVMQGDVVTVKKFIDLGEDVNQKSLGMAPIHYAARYNKAEVLKLLLENGANPKAKCDKGFTALKYAKLSNATEALDVLENALQAD